MCAAPYSIYVNKRPLRIAFLIEDKPESMVIIDTILAYNRDRWGGRYNPIVITDGRTLTDAWWSLLEAMDPDVVKSFVTLADDLIASIERRISPYFIQQPDSREQEDGYQRIHLLHDSLSILPTPLNVRRASWPINESSLVLFETCWKQTDPLVKQFAEWNFGVYSHPIPALNRALESVPTQSHSLTDVASLAGVLTELSTFRAVTYPIQLCSVPNEALPPVAYNSFPQTFEVVIGDTLTDVAYFWNRPATTPQSDRAHLNQVWLPLGMAKNPQLASALSLWIQRSADPNGSGQGRVRFVSLSLSQKHLQEFVEPLTRELRAFRDVNALQEIQPPKIKEGLSGPPSQDKMDLYRATGTIERLTLREPDVLPGASLDEHWMADLYIEFRPERYPTIVGRQLWWQLPRLNVLASNIFRHTSRILRTRYPSVLMRTGVPRLDIALLDDLNVLTALASMPSYPCLTLDARHEKKLSNRTPYYQAWPSDKGRYLSGLLDLYGGLRQATDYFEKRYWRRMFDLLTGRTAHTDAKQLEEVGNSLRKRIGYNRGKFYEDDRAMTWLTKYILNIARRLPAQSRDLPFCLFEKHAMQEIEEYNAHHKGEKPWVFMQDDLKGALAGLTARGVLLVGIKARCPSCGYCLWHHIDDVKQTLQCDGCNTSFPLPPEQQWYYRLNSLARVAYAEHGLLPVVLVLGQLLMEARNAFFFSPCLDLFEKDNKDSVGDLDIAAIFDGKFVIGEVKQSRDLFDVSTFAKMEGIARRLLPDTLLFSSMDRDPSILINKEIARLSDVLRPLNIAVTWYPLHQYKYDASPVR